MGIRGVRGLVFLFVSVGALSGCSQEGDLIVKNEGSTEFRGIVEYEDVTIDPGDSYSKTVYIGKSLAIVGPTGISVTISGSAPTTRAFSSEIYILGDETTTYEIHDNAGAVDLANRYHLKINEVSMKLCSDATFGPNILDPASSIAPGTTKVIQIDPGCWDILVNYGRDELLDTVTAVPIEVGDEITIPWVPGYVYTPPTPSPGR